MTAQAAFRLGRCWPPLLIAIAGLAAYANSLSGPFVFDDLGSILENRTLRHLWPIWPVLSPPSGGLTVSGRPLLNLTLAVNYAIGGADVQSYHAVNLLIHVLAALTLYGIVRRTLDLLRVRPGALQGLGEQGSVLAALAVALLWVVHPLQTESVTYVVQRAESLMGLLYLLTMYSFIRYATLHGGAAPASRGRGSAWAVLSFLACLLGMATKEVMASAPVIVLLYDRTFVAGNFRDAWRARRKLYLALASTWILLAFLVIGGGGGRGGSVGYGAGVSWWAYGLTQFQAIVRYLWLAVWPHPLVFEYGTFWVKDAAEVIPYACVVAPLVAATFVALWRRPACGFLGFWFFSILAPTSLVPGTTQMIVEHRMYLALAPVLAAIVCGGYVAARRLTAGRRLTADRGFAAGAGLAGLAVIAGVCSVLTVLRNRDYRTQVALWEDTTAKRPGSAIAHNNLGTALAKIPGRQDDAIAQYQETLRLDPKFPEAHNDLGNLWLEMPGKLDDAIAQYREAIRLDANFAAAHNGLGNAWTRVLGRLDDAIAEYREALRLKPDYAAAHDNLGNALLGAPGRLDDAIAQFQETLRLEPDLAEAHNSLAAAWYRMPGKLDDAIAEYREALRLEPDFAEAHFNLAVALLQQPGRGRADEARRQLEAFLRLQPGNESARRLLATLPASQTGVR